MAVIVSIEDYQTWQRLAKEQVFTLLETAQRRSLGGPAAVVERDTRAALTELRQPQRRKAPAAWPYAYGSSRVIVLTRLNSRS